MPIQGKKLNANILKAGKNAMIEVIGEYLSAKVQIAFPKLLMDTQSAVQITFFLSYRPRATVDLEKRS